MVAGLAGLTGAGLARLSGLTGAGLAGCLPESPYREEGRSATTDCPPKTP